MCSEQRRHSDWMQQSETPFGRWWVKFLDASEREAIGNANAIVGMKVKCVGSGNFSFFCAIVNRRGARRIHQTRRFVMTWRDASWEPIISWYWHVYDVASSGAQRYCSSRTQCKIGQSTIILKCSCIILNDFFFTVFRKYINHSLNKWFIHTPPRQRMKRFYLSFRTI